MSGLGHKSPWQEAVWEEEVSVELRGTRREHSRSLSYREQVALAAVILNPGYSLDLPKSPR